MRSYKGFTYPQQVTKYSPTPLNDLQIVSNTTGFGANGPFCHQLNGHVRWENKRHIDDSSQLELSEA